jgi:two-component system response regulator FlrC
VLLLGESGTGKEVAAHAIHRLSERAQGPFVAINCATLSENLLESELFGHEKGAFTGATERKRGRLELANGGTFFLDEIGELKPALQARLLRVLQERSFERVGGTRTLEVDVRWIAATHRDLRGQISEGAFREDLYHRLSVFPVRLPALRERPRDILPLAAVLLTRACHELKRPVLKLSEAAGRTLLGGRWSGNIRELANVLERAAILADGDILEPRHLLMEPARAPEPPPSGSGSTNLEELERSTIQRTLEEVGGNRREAAERLGIGVRTLYEKLKRYKLE